MADAELIQLAYTTISRHFVDTGRAPHYAELGQILGVEVNEARELLNETVASASPMTTAWTAQDSDDIECWAPFSNVPNHIPITVDGVQKWYAQ